MKILVFKTDVKSHLELSILAGAINGMRGIVRWSVDMHDVDRVLKVVAMGNPKEHDFMKFVRSQGILCEELPD